MQGPTVGSVVLLGGLPEDQRVAIELRHLQGLTLKQVAENLDRSSAAVAGLLHRGCLRSLLNDAASGE